ncbi:MAG: very short patch repair endonuclease [Desulfobacterales bacterium]|nr:very short patch repair endonuclease [Desulfobacterales bacterium]
MDTVTKEKRSWIMSRIRSNNTKPELVLRRSFYHRGLRYRIHYDNLPGKPDIVFPKQRLAVFVDGCFWHGCPECYQPPKSNRKFWKDKVRMNRKRDRKQTRQLKRLGWTVLRFWEHRVDKELNYCIQKIESCL